MCELINNMYIFIFSINNRHVQFSFLFFPFFFANLSIKPILNIHVLGCVFFARSRVCRRFVLEAVSHDGDGN